MARLKRGRQEYYVTISPTGQITLPADIRRQVQALGRRQLLLRVVDAEHGKYQLEPAQTLGEFLASLKLGLPGGVTLVDSHLREKAEEAEMDDSKDY